MKWIDEFILIHKAMKEKKRKEKKQEIK
jgi:hypothetical protein